MKEEYVRLLLERWVLIDRLLFGEETTPSDTLKGKKYKTYLSSKGAFLSNIFEMYSLLDYEPIFDPGYQEDKLIRSNESEKVLRENFEEMKVYLDELISSNSEKVLEDESGLYSEIKEQLKDVPLTELNKEESDTLISNATKRCFKSRILDRIFLNVCLENVENKEILDSWKFKILNGSYSAFKRSLLDSIYV